MKPSAMLAAAGLVLLAAACTSSHSNGGGSVYSQSLAFSRCMRSHGVPNFPDPSNDGRIPKLTQEQLGATDSQLQSAQDACRGLLPNESAAQRSTDAAQSLAFARCIRSHGVPNFPDPGSNGRIPDPASGGVDQGSQQFRAANDACVQYRPPYFPSNAAYDSWASTHQAPSPGPSPSR